MLNIGVDTGGTFTDFVVFDDDNNALQVAKTASTPDDPTRAFMNGLQELNVDLTKVSRIVHGTTIATNAVLERGSNSAAVVVTKGHRDIVEIGQLRVYADNVIFNRHYQRPAPFIPRNLRYEITERIGPNGETLVAVDDEELDSIIGKIKADGIESVAVCLLNSYANAEHEHYIGERIKKALPNVGVSESMKVSPEFREFERWATTVLNAYVDSSVSRYLVKLSKTLRDAGYAGELFYMTSNGGILTEAAAPSQPVRFLLSGPAAGIRAAVHIGNYAKVNNVITYDMGGTSTDISLIQDLNPIVTHERQFAGTVIKTPQLDIIAIGAGGGSVAWIDKDSSLKVGPRSAGAMPGPACYQRGGTEPTVTDANLLLGRIGESSALGGAMQFDKKLAEKAIKGLGRKIGIDDPYRVAEGILKICNNNMAGAVRTVSVERGLDPRDFALMPMGGAGPMHVVSVAEELGIDHILIPANPGNACATGLLTTDLQHDHVRTYVTEFEDADINVIHKLIKEMEVEGRQQLRDEGLAEDRIDIRCSADMRYSGQSFQLEVPIDENVSLKDLESRFNERYENVYGYNRREKPIELVYLRVIASGIVDKPVPAPVSDGEDESGDSREIYFDGSFHKCSVYQRAQLTTDSDVLGPAVIQEYGSTTVLSPGWQAATDKFGNLHIRRIQE
ncbi:MAG: hydantoinase/oxoprolinase family protein [Gammaproteobacteria bacterium]|nr:hydantoinase/oxoprolinase family protein [Gammaproteobacteria bacterium]